MALFTLTFDTVTKEIKADFDGAPVENLYDVSAYAWGPDKNGTLVGSIQVSSSKYDDETKVQTSVKVYASEEKQKQEDKTELHKSIAKALGCKVN
jgi:hypothetical protein